MEAVRKGDSEAEQIMEQAVGMYRGVFLVRNGAVPGRPGGETVGGPRAGAGLGGGSQPHGTGYSPVVEGMGTDSEAFGADPKAQGRVSGRDECRCRGGMRGGCRGAQPRRPASRVGARAAVTEGRVRSSFPKSLECIRVAKGM